MRACQPFVDGYVKREGVKVHYEQFGAGEPTVLLLHIRDPVRVNLLLRDFIGRSRP